MVVTSRGGAESTEGGRNTTSRLFSPGTIAVDLMLSGMSMSSFSMSDCQGDCSVSILDLGIGLGAFPAKSLLIQGIINLNVLEDTHIYHVGAGFSLLPSISERAHLDLGGEVGLEGISDEGFSDESGEGLFAGAHLGIGTLIKERLSLGIQAYYSFQSYDQGSRNWLGLRIRILVFFPR